VTVSWQTRYLGQGGAFQPAIRRPRTIRKSRNAGVRRRRPIFHKHLHALPAGGCGAAGWTGPEVFGGVNNVFDEQPPFTTIGIAGHRYDLGRFLYVAPATAARPRSAARWWGLSG